MACSYSRGVGCHFSGAVLSERNSSLWCSMWGELSDCFFPLGRAHKHWGWGSELSPSLAKLSLGRGFIQASCCPRRKAICTGCKWLTCILLISGRFHVNDSEKKGFPLFLGGLGIAVSSALCPECERISLGRMKTRSDAIGYTSVRDCSEVRSCMTSRCHKVCNSRGMCLSTRTGRRRTS